MYRQRKTDRGRSGQRSSGHGWTVPVGARLWKRKRASADVFVLTERENRPLLPMWVEEMEMRMQQGRQKEKVRQKHGGKWSGKRFSSSLANVLFLHFIRRFTIARKYLWSGAMCYRLLELCVCACARVQTAGQYDCAWTFVCPLFIPYIHSRHITCCIINLY